MIGRSEHTAILRVLIIEPPGRDGQRLLDALKGGGYAIHVCQAPERESLLLLLRNEPWDVFVLACNLPDFPVTEAFALLQSHAPKIPVVLSIERGAQRFPFELLEKGACDFVFKSNPARLMAVIERECANRQLVGAGQQEPLPAQKLEPIDEGQARFHQLASNIPECYWLADAATQRVSFISAGYEHIWGRRVEALYADSHDWLSFVHDEDRSRVAEAMEANRLGGLDIRFRVQRPGDALRWLHVRNFPVRDEEGSIISVGGVASDVTHLLANKWKSPYFAHFDALTALPNQLMFYDQVQRMIALSKRNGLSLGLMVVDIDRFRQLNQTLGHTSGDELLRQVAGRLSGSLRESDFLGRLGGDIFGILLPDLGDSQQAGIVARRIIDTLIMPVRVDGQDVFATASVGIVFYPQDGQDVHELVSNAEMAGRHAKSQGRNSYQAYFAGMQEHLRERMFLEIDLRNATLCNEFVLYFQPKVSCADGRITGAEALLRWQHPQRGLLSPAAFLPALEGGPLAAVVGFWVLDEACAQAARWRRNGAEGFRIGVNLFGAQFRVNDLVEEVVAALRRHGLPPEALELEITENIVLDNDDLVLDALQRLRHLGVGIAFDDFGTGYASLSLLKRYPLSRIKIDRSFVQSLLESERDAAVVRAILDLSRHFGFETIAEGVENAPQLQRLLDFGC